MVHGRDIREAPSAGNVVMCRWGRKREYYLATLSGVKGLKVDVVFNDGAKKRNVNIGDVYIVGDDDLSIQWKPSVVLSD